MQKIKKGHSSSEKQIIYKWARQDKQVFVTYCNPALSLPKALSPSLVRLAPVL